MTNRNVFRSFREKEEEFTSIFLLEDLIKEYNHKIVSPSLSVQKKRAPLSLRPLKESAANSIIRSSLKDNSVYPVISPMTKEEINSMQSDQLQEHDRRLLLNILQDQVSPKGLISHVNTSVQGASLLELVQEMGLKGKVYYKTVGEKTYVILTGLANERPVLKGTRYLSKNLQLIKLEFLKVDVKNVLKSGLSTSILIYGVVKAVEALDILLIKHGELKSTFFSQAATDLSKLAITDVVSAAATGTVAAAGIPIASGMGIVLVAGFAANIALEFLDRKIGLTEKVNLAADTMLKNLNEYLNDTTKRQQKVNGWDPLNRLVFGDPFARNQQVLRKGNCLVYTA